LALLPFEPRAHADLGGPACTYVGHPLGTRSAEWRPNAAEALRRESDPPVVLLLPGSRRSEVGHLLSRFGAAIDLVHAQVGPLELVLPTVPHLENVIRAITSRWRIPPRVVVDPAEKREAFRAARAAVAASGTVTLELALAQVPTVAAYRVRAVEAMIARRMIRVPSVILANLILGENCIPELLQEECTPDRLANALIPLLRDTPERRNQLASFARLDAVMQIGALDPDSRAADIVISLARPDVSIAPGASIQTDGGR
jgi:lipid-A-disaccharide synthase